MNMTDILTKRRHVNWILPEILYQTKNWKDFSVSDANNYSKQFFGQWFLNLFFNVKSYSISVNGSQMLTIVSKQNGFSLVLNYTLEIDPINVTRILN